ncbi:hypothetical protein GCM10009733_020460 [Nonomuraea maheshkhaliensis]|uniref:Uncharacterized protein n=1 Tax=Nonomuraea maheshkhaliensis TaxID=419590 RepID=A0ABN2F283_9ACTN
MWDGYDEPDSSGYWAPWTIHARRMEAKGTWGRERRNFYAGNGPFEWGVAALMTRADYADYVDSLEEIRVGA